MKHFFLFCLSLTSATSFAATYKVPMIAVACYFPALHRANGFDCEIKNTVRQGDVVVDAELSELEQTLAISEGWYQLGREAIKVCGRRCKDLKGVVGNQCLAIAQSPYFTGYGSFMGRETTLADAKATALRDCQKYVGMPGVPCKIIVEACVPGVN